MDIHGSTRSRPAKSPSINRYLGGYPHVPPSESSVDAELNEDDIFTTDIAESNDHHNQHKNSSSNGNNNNNNNNRKTNFSESFGILAALPESPMQSHFYHKASVSSSSSSSRAIPSIPKPPQERVAFGKYQYQSAPVNVPMLARAMKNNRQFDKVDEDDEAAGEMVPPHEIVARANSPVVACSVLEGVGRTLKGRDLRQVRNAVWHRIGFMD